MVQLNVAIKHSWGELYETLKEMQRNGDETKDPFLLRMINLFDRLDSVNTLDELRTIMEKEKFSEYEQNRINSRCFDGILSTFAKKDSVEDLVKNYSEFTDTILYYKRIVSDDILWNNIIKYDKNELAKFILDNTTLTYDLQLYAFIAMCHDNSAICRLLLQKGVNIVELALSNREKIRTKLLIIKLLIEIGIENDFINYIFSYFTFENPNKVCLVFQKIKFQEKTPEEIANSSLQETQEFLTGFVNHINRCEEKRIEFVKYLLDNGANVHIQNNKAICQATSYNRISMVRLLLEYGADPEAALELEIADEEIEELLQEAAAQRAIVPEN